MKKKFARPVDDLEFVVDALQKAGKDGMERAARKTGVPFHTMLKVAKGETKNPRYRTIVPLVKYFRQEKSLA